MPSRGGMQDLTLAVTQSGRQNCDDISPELFQDSGEKEDEAGNQDRIDILVKKVLSERGIQDISLVTLPLPFVEHSKQEFIRVVVGRLHGEIWGRWYDHRGKAHVVPY